MSIELDPNTTRMGQKLPGMKKQITQDEINLYAKASRDYNPIHIDPEFAKKTILGSTVAHGMLVLAYISQMMTNSFGKYWLSGGGLNIRFKAPARPGDTLSIMSEIRKIQKEREETVISCDVLCSNQRNETVISGEALVRIKNENLN